MKNKSIMTLLLFIVLSFCIEAYDESKVIADLQKTRYGSIFFTNHSESNFKFMMKFLNDPFCYFDKVKKLKNLFEYIEIFDRYSTDKALSNECILYPFLERHFKKIDQKKAGILNHLMLIADGMYGEILSDKYSHLFKDYTKAFIKTLKKTDWKGIVDRLDAGNWEEFRQGIEKLGNSDFETKFKKYVFAQRDEKGNRIPK